MNRMLLTNWAPFAGGRSAIDAQNDKHWLPDITALVVFPNVRISIVTAGDNLIGLVVPVNAGHVTTMLTGNSLSSCKLVSTRAHLIQDVLGNPLVSVICAFSGINDDFIRVWAQCAQSASLVEGVARDRSCNGL